MSRFEIVAREDFSDVTYLLECYHPLMAKAARARERYLPQGLTQRSAGKRPKSASVEYRM